MRRNNDYIEADADQLDRLGPRDRPRLRAATTLTTTLLGLVVVVAGCGGGAKAPNVAGAGPPGSLAQLESYSKCMRSHGISDFPDPTPNPGGPGGGINLNGGPGSDLDPNNPRFNAANQSCQPLLAGGSKAPAASAGKIAAEVKLAHCMRSHGLPSFPDPNGQGAFDRSKIDENSPAFQSASKACQSLAQAAGPIPVVGDNSG
jgi:hypothetical protein